jgi:hypothetical protein
MKNVFAISCDKLLDEPLQGKRPDSYKSAGEAPALYSFGDT